MDRPVGLKLISIFIGLEILLTLLSILQDLHISFVIAFSDVIVIVFGSIALFGLWNLKNWGWKVVIGYAVSDIIISALAAFVFVDLFLESIKSMGLNPDTIRSDLIIIFLFAFIIDSIVIIYVYSKKELFTN